MSKIAPKITLKAKDNINDDGHVKESIKVTYLKGSNNNSRKQRYAK